MQNIFTKELQEFLEFIYLCSSSINIGLLCKVSPLIIFFYFKVTAYNLLL